MRHGSTYVVHNKDPPRWPALVKKQEGNAPAFPSILPVKNQAVTRNIKGSNSWCDPTARALENQKRLLASDLTQKSL